MKLGKAVLLASAFAVMGSAHSAVNIEFAPGVESMFVNGEKKLNLLESTKNITLDNGLNQVVVRVSKLMEGQGQLEKYRSEPIVLTFEANDQTVVIKPTMRLINSVDQSNFDANPSMKLVAKNGSAVQANIDVLPRNKSGDTSTLLGRNFEKELAMYNRAQGYLIAESQSKSASIPEPKTYQIVGAGNTSPQTKVVVQQSAASDGNAMILIQADFLRLPAEQRQAFLKWAKQQ